MYKPEPVSENETHKILWDFETHSLGRILVCPRSNFNFLHNFQWFIFPTQSCIVLWSFPASLLHRCYYITRCEFCSPPLADGLPLEFELLQVSSGLKDSSNILADLNNAIVWMVPARLPIFNSSSLLTKPSLIAPSAPTTIGISVTFMFRSFF